MNSGSNANALLCLGDEVATLLLQLSTIPIFFCL
jgi:hypothetical protein